MGDTVLITGGAGFIGRYVARALIERGDRVRVLDSLIEQVHGDRKVPDGLHPDTELVVGDVRDEAAVTGALAGVDKVVHLAAEVGVGQSMYAVDRYVSVNDLGTAVLFQQLIAKPVKRVVVASSMSIYGEGLYRRSVGSTVVDAVRRRDRLERGEWEPEPGLEPLPTPESKTPSLASVYALTKYDQERLCLIWGGAYDVPTTALRFFNVYGPRQALSNPYTGVLAIFTARLLNGRAPLLYEDGAQRRDFVSVHDVAVACRLALESDGAAGRAVNVGSGRAASVREIALL
ncbi:MAG TPA: NAD-dependent epimerase/dehydratase family protein, partial [Enterovirga sp.]